ncbi:MAG TPA: HD domain-containing protein [Solirubrobacter sp.]|nr:HD domain-containing protein [Solirubrobacter sp.]
MLEPPYALNRALVAEAVTWAAELHGDQRREADHAAFILHPLEVAALLNGRGYDDEVVAAGVLHDSVENTDATVEDVRARFGDRCAAIVAAVSEDPAIEDYTARKAALRAAAFAGGPDVRAVYAADKVAKARELRAQAARDPAVLRDPQVARKLEHYDESLAMLRRAGGHPMVDQLAFELWALRTFPPAE